MKTLLTLAMLLGLSNAALANSYICNGDNDSIYHILFEKDQDVVINSTLPNKEAEDTEVFALVENMISGDFYTLSQGEFVFKENIFVDVINGLILNCEEDSEVVLD